MASDVFTVEEEIKTVDVKRPHVVILGAGASLAAFQNGDRNGRKLPVIKNFVEIVGLKDLLAQNNVQPPYDDFEGLYSDIALDAGKSALRQAIEKKVYDYFAALQLPVKPTLYDHLILSLRPKDVVATFNWDPFLWQAAARNHYFGKTPDLLFLHGNVATGYCPKCKIVFRRDQNCASCGGDLTPSPLLYPVKEKNYQSDPAIANHWRRLEAALKSAWTITFFGYGAPKTDVEAVGLMKKAWGEVENRNLEETEIIDIRSEDDLLETWNPFIHSSHYSVRTSFYDSYIAKHPRRSGEALFQCLLNARFIEGTNFPTDKDFPALHDWLRPRIDVELEKGEL
ncbi:MAG TPA: hypothetical protein VN784_01145 [Candidatus Limnocylindrales bacterium]|nr:hypothetical protein [Candidatus Limnocylindrales bacterium]